MKKAIALLALLLCFIIPVSAANMSDWAKAEFEKATEKKLVPTVLKDADLTQDINRAEFAALSVKLYEALSGTKIKMPAENPFTDTDDREVQKAYAAGITTGIDEGIFGVENPLTREQAATMLTRTYTKSLNAEAKASGAATAFADDASISDWAKESVYFMAENGIINGVGDNMFAPKNNCSREQSVAISVRTFDKFAGAVSVSLRKYIPAFTYGTEVAEFVSADGTTVQYTGVNVDDFMDYVKNVRISYENTTYTLDEAYAKAFVCNNGKYEIKMNFKDGDVAISMKLLNS